ncbi:MAG TPA: hypothetical protein VNZ67_03415, partial [bacterium]|nr:hypothetical protein [bacterium]
MLKPLLWIILALHALSQSGLHAQGLSPASTDLPQRQASWQRLRIVDMNGDGEVLRNGFWLDRNDQVGLYRKHDADDALALMRQSRAHGFAAGFFLVAAPAGLALLGAYLGQQVDQERATNLGATGSGSLYTTWGAGGGALLGLILGGTIHHYQSAASDELRAQAAESYNRKILDDLQLN